MVKLAQTLDAICDRAELLDAIATVATVVPSNSTKPFLSNIIFTARNGCLEVAGTDLELAIRVRVEATEVRGLGSALVNATRALKLVKEFRGARVQVQADSRSGCVLLAEGAKCHVLGDDVRDYPELPSFDPRGDAAPMHAQTLVDMVNRTSFCASKESSATYAMKGMLILLENGILKIVTTDGRRLAIAETTCASKVTFRAIVPTKGLVAVHDLLDEGEDEVLIAVDGNKVLIHTRRSAIIARRVNGNFPPFEGVIPQDCPIKLDVNREDFGQALRLAALLTTRDSQAVKFSFSKKGGLEISSRVPEVGESRVNFAVPFPHAPLEIGFNPVFIQDALKVLRSEQVRFELQGDDSAALITELEEGVPVPGFAYITMPINVL